ncbi:hypothetical protein [Nisaea sp.]|uniref:hypothetical protein n=1 Tax=Nisaea sp. TaxID=2024842 RepID=UPI003B527136
MRTPMQVEGVDRGVERMAQIGVAGSVNPAFWGSLVSAALPVLKNAAAGALQGALNG